MRLGEVREMVIKGIWEWDYKKSGNEGGWNRKGEAMD